MKSHKKKIVFQDTTYFCTNTVFMEVKYADAKFATRMVRRSLTCIEFAPQEERVPLATADTSNAMPQKTLLSFWDTLMHTIILGVCPAILSVPFAFQEVGYVPGVIGIFFIVFLYLHCLHMVVSSERQLCKRLGKSHMSYGDLLRYSLNVGPKCLRSFTKYSKFVLCVFMLSSWTLGNSLWAIFIGDSVRSFLQYFFDVNMSERTIIMYAFVPLVLLCWIPNLNFLVIGSIISNAINVMSTAFILYEASQNIPTRTDPPFFGNLWRLPNFLGTIFFNINGTVLLITLRHEMKKPAKFTSYFGVLNLSYVPLAFLYAAFGLLCTMKYGSKLNENVILNMPNNTLTNVIVGLHALGVLFQYPLMAYAIYDFLWNDFFAPQLKSSPFYFTYEYIFRTINASTPVLMALGVPSIGLYLALVGTVCSSVDSIILPATIQLILAAGQKIDFTFFKNVIIALFGCSMAMIGLLDTYQGIAGYVT